MFQETPGVGPISMIITNLAAHAYAGETDLWCCADRTSSREMPDYVNPTRPRVPNPADPAEDYADKWARDPALEENFWQWHTQVKVDLARLPAVLSGSRLASDIRSTFRVELTREEIGRFEPRDRAATPVIVRSAPALHISTAPRPWGDRA